MGLWVGPGTHTVQLTFRPVYWELGVTVACVCGMLLALLLGIAAFRRKSCRVA